MSDELDDTFTTHLSDEFEQNADKTLMKSCINGIVKTLEDKFENKPTSLSIRIPPKTCTTVTNSKFCSPSWEYSSDDDDSDALFSPLFPPRARAISISSERESNTNQAMHLISEESAFPSENGDIKSEDNSTVLVESSQSKCKDQMLSPAQMKRKYGAVDLNDDTGNVPCSTNQRLSSGISDPTLPGCVNSPKDRPQLANAVNEEGESALCIASHQCFLEGIQMLIASGADVSSTNTQKCNPLHMVCLDGCEKINETQECLDILLYFDADPNSINVNGKTPLHLASESGDDACVQMLIHHGAKPDIADLGGNTPLHYATRGNHRNCMKILLGEDVEINRSTHVVTPSIQSSWECESPASPVDMPVEGESNRNCDVLNGDTALKYDARGDWVQCNESDYTYYYNTVTNVSSWEDPSAFNEKNHHFGNEELDVECINKTQISEQHFHHEEGLESATNDRHLAIWSKFFENTFSRPPESLGEHKIETKKGRKRTRKKRHTMDQSLEILNLSEGDVVHYAARTDDAQALIMLIENGFDVLSTDMHGNTPLHVASMYGCETTTNVLLNTNICDLNAVNYRGETPTFLAKCHGHDLCANLFTMYEDGLSKTKSDIENAAEENAKSSSAAWSFLGSWLGKPGNSNSSLPPPPPPIDIPANVVGVSLDNLLDPPDDLKRALEDRKKLIISP